MTTPTKATRAVADALLFDPQLAHVADQLTGIADLKLVAARLAGIAVRADGLDRAEATTAEPLPVRGVNDHSDPLADIPIYQP